MTKSDTAYIELAISEAAKCPGELGRTTPRVGAVVVSNGQVTATGFRGEGDPGRHAEYVALEVKLSKGRAAGATVYTTLEPCTMRSPEKTPCTARLIQRKVARVVIGMLDPNQNICGRGIRALRDAGITVDLFPAELMARVEEQNRHFTLEQENIARLTGLGLPAVNPFYSNDLDRLDGHFELRTVLRPQTILIVTGTGIVSELLDRHAAAILRDEINLRARRKGQRALVVSSHVIMTDARVQQKSNPAISVGADIANPYTKTIQDAAKAAGKKPWVVKRANGIFCDRPPRVALWGQLAQDTYDSVQHYIKAERGLSEFLRYCWS